MRKRFKIPLMFVGLLIILVMLIGFCYIFYDKFIDDSVVIVDEQLSINFINGNRFDEEHNKKLSFSITNNGTEDIYYFINFNDIVGTANYKVECPENAILINGELKAGIISSYIEIDGKTTQNYTIEFTNGSAYSGEVNVQKEASNYETFADVLLSNNEVKEEPITKLGEAATTNEGLIKSTDDTGTTYYYRGVIDNNYVSFAGLMWRIVRINGDGSIRLVLNNSLSTIDKYYNSGDTTFNYASSNIKLAVDNFYQINLSSSSDLISTLDFCNDTAKNAAGYKAYNRIMVDKIVSFKCLNESIRTTIGLLTIDEAVAAGAPINGKNEAFYLYNSEIEQSYYLMSSAKGDGTNYYPYLLTKDGAIDTASIGTLYRGVRPVINIIKNVTVEGTGTIDNPYTIVSLESN